MLDNLDLDISLDKETYDAKIEVLMKQLRSLQLACREKKLPAIIVLEGWPPPEKARWSKKWWGTWTRGGLGSTRFGRRQKQKWAILSCGGIGRNSPPAAKLVFFTTVGTLIF